MTKIVAARKRWDELAFHRFVVRVAMVEPAQSDPSAPLFRVTGVGYGERVRLRAAVVREDDLLRS